MNQDKNQFGVEYPVDMRLDADAVCAQCGTVNPEETLICKSCGNNLRDQRAMRLAANDILDESDRSGSWWLRPAMTLLGVLIIIWAALNVGRIEQWLTDIQSPGISTAGIDYLYDTYDSMIGDMLTSVSVEVPSGGEIKALMESPVNVAEIAGTYVLVSKSTTTSPTALGLAKVNRVADGLLFVAKLPTGAEICGLAEDRGTHYFVDWANASYVDQGEEYGFTGVAMKKADGAFDCYGQSGQSDSNYEFKAYRLP